MKGSVKSRFALLLMTVAGTVLIPPLARANDADTLRTTQMQLRQSEQERSALRAEVARLQQQLTMQNTELTQTRQQAAKTVDTTAKEDSAMAGKLAKTSKALGSAQAELETLRAQVARQQHAAADVRTLLDRAEKKLALRDELVELCRSRNRALYDIGVELLALYRDDDMDSVAKREPVLQLQQVKLENLMQEFAAKLHEQRVYADTLPPSQEQAMRENIEQRRAQNAQGAGAQKTDTQKAGAQ